MSPHPGRTDLYRLFDADGVLLYIGISNQFPARLSEHRTWKPWGRRVDHWTVEEYATRWAAEDAEIEAISTEGPVFNVHYTQGSRCPTTSVAS